jgi:phosphoribosylformylglycinamidine synthase
VGVNASAERVLPSAFQAEGNAVLLIGETRGAFGGSLYFKELFDATVGALEDVEYSQELRLWQLVIEANADGWLRAAKDLSAGGIAIALAKMAAVGDHGVEATVTLEDPRWIFDETQSRALLEVAPQHVEDVARKALELGLQVEKIGTVGGTHFRLNDLSLPMDRLKQTYFNRFAEVIEQDL